MSKSFYAVANGRTQGVFLTWSECEKSVKDFPGAKFKKFTSEQEAQDFCKAPGKTFTKSTTKPTTLNSLTKSKYSTITFDSESDSDQEQEVKAKSKPSTFSSQKKLTPSNLKPQVNNFVNTRAEEESIRANINFDTSDSDSDSDSETDSKPLTKPVTKPVTKSVTKPESKLIIEDMDNQSESDDDLEVMMKTLLSKNSELEPKSKPTPTHSSVLSELGDFVPDIVVYTDGACIDNGGTNAKAGIGVYFGPKDPRNVSEPVQGKQSNNTAELGALSRAYSILSPEISTGKKVAFFTDSKYGILCLTTYGNKLEKDSWKKLIPNKELVKQIYEQFGCKTNPNIKLIHIKAHTSKQDTHSLGNEQADQLANAAIGISTLNKKDESKKIYLKVPFAKKDQAKKLGCRWDPDAKSWYCFESNTKALEQLGGKI